MLGELAKIEFERSKLNAKLFTHYFNGGKDEDLESDDDWGGTPAEFGP